jgi:hypothetical protein
VYKVSSTYLTWTASSVYVSLYAILAQTLKERNELSYAGTIGRVTMSCPEEV